MSNGILILWGKHQKYDNMIWFCSWFWEIILHIDSLVLSKHKHGFKQQIEEPEPSVKSQIVQESFTW
jgi:hypothetical protein